MTLTLAPAETAAARLAALLPEGVATAGRLSSGGGALWPGEALARAVPARQAEFAAGRAATRAALATLGHGAAAIPMGPDRAPVWPEGISGSITHGAGLCLAAVARRGDIAALGIDVEADSPLPEGMEALICTPAERAWLDRRGRAGRGRRAKAIFCAKEAAYKCQYPLSGALFGFDALEIAFPEPGRFTARFTRAAGPFAPGDTIDGRHACAGGLTLAACWLPG